MGQPWYCPSMDETPGTVQWALRHVAIFRDVPEAERAFLADAMQPRHYGRNEVIFPRGVAGDGLYIIMEGQISISREGMGGDEIILTMEDPGEYFGELSLFDNEPRSATATSLTSSSLLFLGRPAFQSFLATHPAAVLACLHIVVRMLRRCTDLVDELALLDVRSRLAHRLLYLADHAGTATVRITQQQLAGMAGTTRESINKHLSALVDDQVIRLDRGSVQILDANRLAEYSIDSF